MRRHFSASLSRTVRIVAFAAIALSSSAHAGSFEDFFKAAKGDNADEIAALLQRGLDPNLIEEERGDTGMIVALREGAMKSFTVLVNARNIDIDAQSRNGDTALMIAAFKGNLPAVETLLVKGATVNRPGAWCALHYAAAAGSNDIVKLLLSKGAQVDAESPNKTTPIMMAARGGHILTVKLLLDSGADAAARNEADYSAIDFANQFGHKDIVEGLTYRLKKAGKL